MARIILHLDMDAFFASIEERENPKLRGMPIVIGADPKGGAGRGVVSTASYAARKFGIRSALPISQAWKLCPAPRCVYLPVDMRLYGIVSERIMKIVRECVAHFCHSEERSDEESRTNVRSRIRERSFADAQDGKGGVEQVSVDEAYVEIKNAKCKMQNCWEEAEQLAYSIKREIQNSEHLSCSIGIAPNKLVAKIASDFKKPDGLTIVRDEEVEAFLSPMSIRKLPGIGPKTEATLARRGIQTVADLRLALSENDELYLKACGKDDTPVVEEYEIKSLGHEITFDRDTRDQSLLVRTIMDLCNEVLFETQNQGVAFRTITVRVRFDNFETHTSAHSLKALTQDGILLQREAFKLLFPYFKGKRAIRLIGVRVSNLQSQ